MGQRLVEYYHCEFVTVCLYVPMWTKRGPFDPPPFCLSFCDACCGDHPCTLEHMPSTKIAHIMQLNEVIPLQCKKCEGLIGVYNTHSDRLPRSISVTSGKP